LNINAELPILYSWKERIRDKRGKGFFNNEKGNDARGRQVAHLAVYKYDT